jgi:hypothetical protein
MPAKNGRRRSRVIIVKIIAAQAVAVQLIFLTPVFKPAREYAEKSGLTHKGLARQEIVNIPGKPVERGITD